MKFTIHVSVNAKKEIKNELIEVIANHLNKKSYRFDVGYDPSELDTDSMGKA